MRRTYDTEKVNLPHAIAGLEWKLFALIVSSFGMIALMFKAWLILILPVLIILFLQGPARRDQDFMKVYKRHAAQSDRYSPANVCEINNTNLRPEGFGRFRVM